MQISDILSPDRVLFDVECDSKKNALDMLAQSLADADSALSQITIFDCFLARERLGSTGLGNGIAIPHGRLKYNPLTLATFIQLKYPVDYDAIDKKPVDLLFALIVPEDSTEEHLQILSMLSVKFSEQKILDALRNTNSSQSMYALLTAE